MKNRTIYLRCLFVTLMCCGLIFTLSGEELKEKKPIEQDEEELVNEDDGSWKKFDQNSFPYNADIPGFVLNGYAVVTIIDANSKKNTGTETIQFLNNLGMRILRLGDASADFDYKLFKVKTITNDDFILNTTYSDEHIGSLVLEVAINGNTPEISGRMIFTKPDGKPEIKLFTGRYVFSRSLNPTKTVDPIPVPTLPPLTLKSINAKSMSTFNEVYVDAIEKHYAEHVPAALAVWFKANQVIRKDFWLAISSQFDDVKAACEIMEALRAHNAKAVEKFPHLAIAIAVVYDSPNAISDSRMKYLWAVTPSQFSPVCSYIETFDYFSDQANQSRFTFKPDQLPWPILVHLVDFDISKEEITWAWANCSSSRKDIADLYQTVPYDYDKLARKTPKLGSSAYTLENLRYLGGVCVDQAHFTSRVGKAFGVPSMKVAGRNRYGGLHAWTGFLVNAQGRAQLDFTGRYLGDYYYIGDIYDPQTNTMILDREMAMLYDGISLSFFKYQDSMTLARAAQQLINSDAATAMLLAEHAINCDTFNPIAWRLLANGVSTGVIDQKQGNVLVTRLMKDLVNHPDLTLECLNKFMVAIPLDDISARQKIFTKAYGLYAKRPDLQIQLRLIQCAELVAANKQADALQISLQTCSANAKEGGLILPLVEYIVSFSKEFAAKNPKFPLATVKKLLSKIEDDFPQKRGEDVSKAYTDFKTLIMQLE